MYLSGIELRSKPQVCPLAPTLATARGFSRSNSLRYTSTSTIINFPPNITNLLPAFE